MSKRKLVAYVALSWVPHALGYVAAPNAIAAAGMSVGGSIGPGPWSLVGLPFVAAGAGLIGWAIVSHYRAGPDELEVTARPSYLATTGAYAISRNPLYVGGALLWVGWALVWLSVVVVGAGILLFGFLASVGVPYEERHLRRRHGAAYDEYCDAVAPWLPIRR